MTPHSSGGGLDGYYEMGPGEYHVPEPEYHYDYYGNRYGKYDRKDVGRKENKLLDIELQKPIEVDFDGGKPTVTLQGIDLFISHHLSLLDLITYTSCWKSGSVEMPCFQGK